MTREVGTFSHGMDGPLRISVEAGRYRIEVRDSMVRRSDIAEPYLTWAFP